jgi:predicted amidohydrolase
VEVKAMSIQIKIKKIPVIVYPEFGLTKEEAINKARITNAIVVTGFKNPGQSVLVTDGKTSFVRPKLIHPLTEVPKELQSTGVCETFIIRGLKILPIICYELMFPDLWMNLEKPDLVTHHIGFPMFDVSQMEGWKALHRVLAKYYKCPVVVSCGGERGPLNPSGIVYPDRNIIDYSLLYEQGFDKHWR